MAEDADHDTLGGRSHAPELPLPYFEAWRGDDSPTRARYLLVAPRFPPDASVGALRWEKFASHFAERGRKLDVLAREPSELNRVEWGRLDDLPGGTRAYGADTPALALDRLESSLRRWLAPRRRPARSSSVRAGDAWLPPEEARRRARSPRGVQRAYRAWRHLRQQDEWSDRAVSLGSSLAITVDYRAVITCGPPHVAHLAGRRVARRIGRPLVLDLRDPWSLVEALPEVRASPVWLRHADRAEARCVAEARLVVVSSEPHREALAERYPEAADRIATVLDGFDADVIEDPPEPADQFLVACAGTGHGGGATRSFLRASHRVVRSLGLTPENFRIEFLGDVSGLAPEELEALARDAGVGDHFEATGALPRPEALRRAARAAVLLNLPQRSGLCIPARIYEYLQMDGYILALENPDTATARLLDGTDADVVGPDDVEAIARVLRNRYQAFAGGQLPPSEPPDPDLASEAQAEKFLRLLARKLDRGPPVDV